MDQLKAIAQKARSYLLIGFIGIVGVIVVVALGLNYFTELSIWLQAIILVVVGGALSWLAVTRLQSILIAPFEALAQAVLHTSPDSQSVAAPDVTQLQLGRELVSALAMQVYQYASQQDNKELAQHREKIIQAANVVSHLPLPMFVFNKQQIVTNASNSALEYCHIASADLFGKPLYETINLEFASEATLEAWIKQCQTTKVTDMAYWQRVRVRLPDNSLHQCDMAAYYNRENPSGTEFIVTLFDRTDQYNQDDQDLGFVSLAVHELRTPLTMLRGYIEVFEEELDGKLDPQLLDFMHKMKVSAAQLGTFFNNIMNVARIEQNQLVLKLNETSWPEVLTQACNELNLKAQVHGKSLKVTVAPDLPSVGLDKVSIVEVINNLIDNAIKYGRSDDTIEINAQLNDEGLVETTVRDHGQGVPSGVMPHLFDKFYRNHRTAAQVGGTGLGLYLSKAIIKAHGGDIWVQSKDGEGAVVGFTLLPYSRLAVELKNTDNNGIVRSAHGWIKNHSLYRR